MARSTHTIARGCSGMDSSCARSHVHLEASHPSPPPRTFIHTNLCIVLSHRNNCSVAVPPIFLETIATHTRT